MPIRAQVCTWIVAFGLLVPSAATGQDRTEREIVELIIRDGPQARAIRAETEVVVVPILYDRFGRPARSC